MCACVRVCRVLITATGTKSFYPCWWNWGVMPMLHYRGWCTDAIMYEPVQVVVYWIYLLFNAHCCRKKFQFPFVTVFVEEVVLDLPLESSVQFQSPLLTPPPNTHTHPPPRGRSGRAGDVYWDWSGLEFLHTVATEGKVLIQGRSSSRNSKTSWKGQICFWIFVPFLFSFFRLPILLIYGKILAEPQKWFHAVRFPFLFVFSPMSNDTGSRLDRSSIWNISKIEKAAKRLQMVEMGTHVTCSNTIMAFRDKWFFKQLVCELKITRTFVGQFFFS